MNDSIDEEHVILMERGSMALRMCVECDRLAAKNSGERIDHKESCSHYDRDADGNDAKNELDVGSRYRTCGVCGDEYHTIDIHCDTHERFSFNNVCIVCITRFLECGEWKPPELHDND